jgi:hypothetical protein
MNPLAEPKAVALLLQHATGWVHVFCDGSSRWSPDPPDGSHYWDAGDVPEAIPCQRRSYQQARAVFSASLKRMRARGVAVG